MDIYSFCREQHKWIIEYYSKSIFTVNINPRPRPSEWQVVWETVHIGVQKNGHAIHTHVLRLIKVYLHESCIFLSLIFSVLFRLFVCYLSIFLCLHASIEKNLKWYVWLSSFLVVSFEGSLHVMLQLTWITPPQSITTTTINDDGAIISGYKNFSSDQRSAPPYR